MRGPVWEGLGLLLRTGLEACLLGVPGFGTLTLVWLSSLRLIWVKSRVSGSSLLRMVSVQ